MSYDLNDDEFNFDDDQTQGPKALREQVKKLAKQLETLTGELEAERKEKAELAGQVKSVSLRDALSAAGVDAKFLKVAEKDGVEPTEEAVKKWVKENEDIYSFKPVEAKPQQGEPDGEEEQEFEDDETDEELRAAIEAGQATESAGRPSGSSTTIQALEQANANLGQFKTEAEIDAYLAQLGAPRR